VRTRLHATDAARPATLSVIEQWCAPGRGAPTHAHPGVEEVVTFLEGEAEAWLGDDRFALAAGDSVVFPPGSWHGFRNTGEGDLHVLAIFASPLPTVVYADEPEVTLEIGGRRAVMHDEHRAVRDET
jgi:mannose-6-phosphate isomerase-like protein (cupin superfamily)